VKKKEKQKCALFGLWTLTGSSKWGDQEVKAWNMLSGTIVSRKPPLPTATRAWLFSQLREVVREQFLFVTDAGHVLRACLVRLHSFCKSDHSVEVPSKNGLLLCTCVVSSNARDRFIPSASMTI
jgi:hypothetical protein